MIEAELVKVSMADLNVAFGGAVIRTTGLGSCVGVTIYDPVLKAAGLAHIMLPSSEIAREGQLNTAKYADTAIPELLRRLKQAGADPKRLVAKIAGGAQMFAFVAGNDSLRIGPRNVESSKQALEALGIPLLAEDTGSNYGRTVEMDSGTGVFVIRSVQFGVKEI